MASIVTTLAQKSQLQCWQDVVWERLSAVDGNTEYVDASFNDFHGRSVMRDALAAARLAQDAFKDVLPSQGVAVHAVCLEELAWRISHCASMTCASVGAECKSQGCKKVPQQHERSRRAAKLTPASCSTGSSRDQVQGLHVRLC